MAWIGLKTDMTVSSGDLELDPGAQLGEYLLQDGANDYFDTGSVGRWRVNCIFNAQEGAVSPDNDTNEISVRLFISLTSLDPGDDADWSDFVPYVPGEYECRYYRIKGVVKVEDAFQNQPKITEMTPSHTPVGSLPHAASVDAILEEPAGTEEVGYRCLVDPSPTGIFVGHGDKVAELVDSTNDTWEYFLPVRDQELWVLSTDWKYVYELADYPGGNWVPRGLTSTTPEKDKFAGGVQVIGVKSIDWGTDGGGNVGNLPSNRPDYVHAKTGMTINGVAVIAGPHIVLGIYSCLAGVAVGDCVAKDATNDNVILADASDQTKPAFGFVRTKLTSTTCEVQRLGELGGFAGLTAGDRMYLSRTAGQIAAALPSLTLTGIHQVVAIAKNATTIEIVIEPPMLVK